MLEQKWCKKWNCQVFTADWYSECNFTAALPLSVMGTYTAYPRIVTECDGYIYRLSSHCHWLRWVHMYILYLLSSHSHTKLVHIDIFHMNFKKSGINLRTLSDGSQNNYGMFILHRDYVLIVRFRWLKNCGRSLRHRILPTEQPLRTGHMLTPLTSPPLILLVRGILRSAFIKPLQTIPHPPMLTSVTWWQH